MILLAAAVACASPPDAGPDASSQTYGYARRSVQIIALAAAGDSAALQKFVSLKATFSLGAGDVGQPFKPGSAGAIEMAGGLKAATYSFSGWDYIPIPRDVCGEQQVEVTFVTADHRDQATVKFKYNAGVLISADGWLRSRNEGRVELEKING